MVNIPISPVAWQPCYRIISSRFPPTTLFDRVASENDMQMIFTLENMTNPRIREELGDLSLVPPEERVYGPGSTPIMAAFTHINGHETRFSDGSYGVYYAAIDPETAIAETVYHREKFLAYTNEPPIDLTMRVYAVDLRADLHDIRGLSAAMPDIYHPTEYRQAQALGAQLRNGESWGIVYDSVRREGGQCAGVFRPKALSNCRQSKHLSYQWNGHRITHVLELSLLY